jgi:serine/threonine protein kinase
VSEQITVSPLRQGDPAQLGSYRLVGRIGRGGMGTVYLAESGSGERLAVKVINPDLAHDDAFRTRFRREVESARRVRRFCTAPVVDAQLDGEPLYIVTEYVDGSNLDEFIRSSGPMRGSSLDHLAVGVATALTAIHGAGVIHRDLKPANVLLSSVGPRVIDFGIARALDTVSEATRTGQFVGTPAYMAPEVFDGKSATAASDVFAWGCVVAYAGTGQTPFTGPTVPAIMYQIMHAEPALDGIDESLRGLVERALAKDPAQRPSGQELLDSLVGQNHADTAQAAESLSRTWPGETARDVTMPAGAPGTRADLPPTARHPGPPPTMPAPPQRAAAGGVFRRTPVIVGAAAGAVVLLAAVVAVMLLRGSGGPPDQTKSVFGDDFSNTSTSWGGGNFTSSYGYINGMYRLATGTTSDEQTVAAPYDQVSPPRLLISADVVVRSGPDYGQVGLWCRGDANRTPPHGYHFLVRVDGKGAVIRKVSEQAGSKQLAEASEAKGYKRGKTNRIQAACDQEGSKINLRLWLNGSLVAEATDGDSPLPNTKDTGEGVTVTREGGGSGGDMTADFDNFDMSRIG